MTAKYTVNLVLCDQYYYPITKMDRQLLVAAKYTPARIPVLSFPMLKTAFLSELNFNIHTWDEVRPQLLREFTRALENDADLAPHLESARGNDGSFRLLLSEPNSVEESLEDMAAELTGKGQKKPRDREDAEPPKTPLVKKLETHLSQLRNYLGQYSFKLMIRSKFKADINATLFVLSIESSADIPFHIFYDMETPATMQASLLFGTSFRVMFEKTELGEEGVLRIQVGDRMLGSTDWQTSFIRSFKDNLVDRASAMQMVNFLLTHFS